MPLPPLRYALSLAVASRRFGARPPALYYPVKEPGEGRFSLEPLAADDVARVLELNAADARLHDAAVARLERDAVELFGSLAAAEACARYDCRALPERMTIERNRRGELWYYAETVCVAQFDIDACAAPPE